MRRGREPWPRPRPERPSARPTPRPPPAPPAATSRACAALTRPRPSQDGCSALSRLPPRIRVVLGRAKTEHGKEAGAVDAGGIGEYRRHRQATVCSRPSPHGFAGGSLQAWRIRVARIAAFLALSTPTQPTGTPGGICVIASNASSPPATDVLDVS